MSLYHIILITIGIVALFSGGALFGTVWTTVSLTDRLLIKLQGIVNNINDNICPEDCNKRKEMIKQILTETLKERNWE